MLSLGRRNPCFKIGIGLCACVCANAIPKVAVRKPTDVFQRLDHGLQCSVACRSLPSCSKHYRRLNLQFQGSMQKAQTRGGDRGYTVPSTHFQAAFPDLSDVNLRSRSGAQLGQASLHKLLELSRESNSVGLVRCRGRSDAATGSCSKHADSITMHTHSRASRSQQIQRSLQDLSIAPGKQLLDRLLCQTAPRKPLPACNSAMQTAPANLCSQSPSATKNPLLQQGRHIQGTNGLSEPAQQRSCKIHRSPLRPTSVISERILSDGSANAADLLAHHRKRLMSADSSSLALGNACPSGSGGNSPLSARRKCKTNLSHTDSMQQVQAASSWRHSTEPAPLMQSRQLVQLQTTAALSQSSMLTSATLHKHDAAELPFKQESNAPSDVVNAEMGSEDSDSSSFFTDTADSRLSPCFLPNLSSSGLDCDDCLSVGTSQGITDGSSSMGDADTADRTTLKADALNMGMFSSSAL